MAVVGALKGVFAPLLLATALLSATGCYHTFPLHPGASAVRDDGTIVYIVKRGDTLYSIGRRFGLNPGLLARRNHLEPPYTIYVGQQLYINRTAPRARRLPVRMAQAIPPRARAPAKHVKARPRARETARSSPAHSPANHRGAAKLLWPVRGKVTSGFGRRGNSQHDGIDIAAPEGTPVRAAAAGTVVYADRRLSGYGNLIIIRHAGDLFTAYAHNQRNLVRKGDRVRAGEIIARVGRTGRATGPHLHFEVRRGPVPVDPLAYLPR